MKRALNTAVALAAAAAAACAFAQSAPQQTQQPPQTQPQPERPRSAAAGGSAVTPANAAQDADARRVFRELDRNGDGRIEPSEFSTLKSAR